MKHKNRIQNWRNFLVNAPEASLRQERDYWRDRLGDPRYIDQKDEAERRLREVEEEMEYRRSL